MKLQEEGCSSRWAGPFLCCLGDQMVRIHIKRGDESQFLYETTVNVPIDQLIIDLTRIFNGRLKVERLCQGIV